MAKKTKRTRAKKGRGVVVSPSFTVDEYRTLERAAKREYMHVGAFIRRAALRAAHE